MRKKSTAVIERKMTDLLLAVTRALEAICKYLQSARAGEFIHSVMSQNFPARAQALSTGASTTIDSFDRYRISSGVFF